MKSREGIGSLSIINLFLETMAIPVESVPLTADK